ncbi:metal-binding protein, partial [Vibrio anguillarum]|nr:metal-binding protein [Vibrio anguillarum]
PLTIAVCASISPYYDLNHNKMQNTGNPNDNFQHIAISTVTIDGNAAYVISYLSEHSVIDTYVKELISKGNKYVKSWLMKSIFAYTENCFFKLSWWSSLSLDVQEKVYALAISENYTKPFKYDDLVSATVTGDIV